MSLKYYFDSHIPKQVALQLRLRGVDVVRSFEVGLVDADDETHLAHATENNRVLVSVDRDFHIHYKTWAEESRPHAGILSISQELASKRRIGYLVNTLFEYWELVEGGAGSWEADFYNLFNYLK